jgi:hypothetical protein
MTKLPESERERIQRSRNLVLAVLLGGFAVLVFAIALVKMS